jgi:FkbM family methyltransferase
MYGRVKNLTGKGWQYSLAMLEKPGQLLQSLLRLSRGAHPREYLKMNRKWVAQAGIQTVIDVGAHAGEFSSAIHAVLPNARIYAFEPLPDCCATLRRKANGNLTLFQVAIGDRNDEMTFWRNDSSKSSSLLPMSDIHKFAFPWTSRASPTGVEVRTLDSYLPEISLRRKVLLKLDIEGYEAHAIRGAAQLLKSIDYVLLEVAFQNLYEGQSNFDELHSALSRAGFAFAGNMDQVLSPLDESIMIADALFVRAGS